MGNRLYVGNVAFVATNESLGAHFAQAGVVTSAQIMVDKLTGRPRGFAFVTMAGDADVQRAVTLLHGKPFEGRPLTVTEARPREDRPAGAPAPRRDFTPNGGASPGGFSPPKPSFSGGGGAAGRRPDKPDRGSRGERGERGERGGRPERTERSGRKEFTGGRNIDPNDLDDLIE